MLELPANPTPARLREIREWLGLSQMEFALALGFQPSSGERLIRRWEFEQEFAPTPVCWTAIKYLVALASIQREIACAASWPITMKILPETLK